MFLHKQINCRKTKFAFHLIYEKQCWLEKIKKSSGKIERDQILRKKFLVKMKLTKRPSKASHHLQNNESVALQATRKHIQIDVTKSKLKFFRKIQSQKIRRKIQPLALNQLCIFREKSDIKSTTFLETQKVQYQKIRQ